MKTIKTLGIAASAAFLTVAAVFPASADTVEDTYPETPATNVELPVVNTYHGSDHIKANILNPSPVCNSGEDFRTTVYKATQNFVPAGTISTTNNTSEPVPLTQTLSRNESLSLSVDGGYTDNTSVNLGGTVPGKDGESATAGISKSITKNLGFNFSYSLSWSVGQQIGPYEVPAGYSGEATYGFETITLSGTQQYCKPNGTWSTPTAWSSIAPIRNTVKVQTFNTATGSRTESDSNTTFINEVDKYQSTVSTEKPAEQQALDLEPYFTVAAGKAKGYAGLVALRVKNVGTDQYWEDGTTVSFRVDVKTADGPEGVDRLITPGWFNGAYTRDLGFDKETSTRSFLVTLSNPVEAGDDVLVANLNFGDGDTKRGRIVNFVTVTQIGRASTDTTGYNDQNVDSRQATLDGMGRTNAGLF